ncbi:hypothetical protein ILUMI_20874 [Ignelater luminosus]|uniref:Uncharacterized protein n=1 Tax=Ignelater luminosus TaxID=2038154 RepID=A0A8K0CDJ5_IGNLU|nr:hypothetical protein ILUMI_20874 [Ignelater luminosus]
MGDIEEHPVLTNVALYGGTLFLTWEFYNRLFVIPKITDLAERFYLEQFNVALRVAWFSFLLVLVYLTVKSFWRWLHKPPESLRRRVANTDLSYRSGQHWCAIFIDENGYGEGNHLKFIERDSKTWCYNLQILQKWIKKANSNVRLLNAALKKYELSVGTKRHFESSIARMKEPIRGSSYMALPSEIAKKRGVIKVKNNDDACFAWAVTSALHPAAKNSGRVSLYLHYTSVLNLESITFPMTINKIKKFEKQNQISINVFMLEKTNKGLKVVSAKITKQKLDRHIDLLVMQDSYDDDTEETKYHWSYTEAKEVIGDRIAVSGLYKNLTQIAEDIEAAYWAGQPMQLNPQEEQESKKSKGEFLNKTHSPSKTVLQRKEEVDEDSKQEQEYETDKMGDHEEKLLFQRKQAWAVCKTVIHSFPLVFRLTSTYFADSGALFFVWEFIMAYFVLPETAYLAYYLFLEFLRGIWYTSSLDSAYSAAKLYWKWLQRPPKRRLQSRDMRQYTEEINF